MINKQEIQKRFTNLSNTMLQKGLGMQLHLAIKDVQSYVEHGHPSAKEIKYEYNLGESQFSTILQQALATMKGDYQAYLVRDAQRNKRNLEEDILHLKLTYNFDIPAKVNPESTDNYVIRQNEKLTNDENTQDFSARFHSTLSGLSSND